MDVDNVLNKVNYFFVINLLKVPGKKFIIKWMQMLKRFVVRENFKCFYPEIPVLPQLMKHSIAVLIVATYNKEKYSFLRKWPITVFPLNPFKIYFTHNSMNCSREEIVQLLIHYLRATRIRMIGFHNIHQEDEIRNKLITEFPMTRIYTSRLFKYFCAKVRK